MPGDPDVLPFAGIHRGIDAAHRAVRTFFDMVEVYDLDAWTTELVSCNGNEVIAVQLVPAQLKGLSETPAEPCPPTLAVYRITIERGRITVFDDKYPVERAMEDVRVQAYLKKKYSSEEHPDSSS